jgi:hypothetical protein
MHGLGFFKHVSWGGAPFFLKNGEEKAPPRLSFRKEELKERTPAHSHRSILRARYCGMPCSAPGTAPGGCLVPRNFAKFFRFLITSNL